MSKDINFSPRHKLKAGFDIVANAGKLTIGPRGRNVAIEQGGTPIIANDSGTIAKFITLKDPIENIGAQMAKDLIQKTSEAVGGGRTAAVILGQAIIEEGIKAEAKGVNMNIFHQGMNLAVKDITEKLKSLSRPVTTPEEIFQIASISTESPELGAIISDVINQVGKNCDVKVEEAQTLGVTSKIENGFRFDKGWISPFMVTNPERMEAEMKDVYVLVTDKKISMYKDIFPIIKSVTDGGKNQLVVICEDFDGEALNNCIIMKLKGAFNLLAIKIPGYQDKKEWLDDIALCTGAQVASDQTGIKLSEAKFGIAKNVTSNQSSTLLLGTQDTKAKAEELKLLQANTESKYEQDKLEKRIAILNGSVAVIKVGAATESELKYLKLKIEDGVNESKRALEEGIVIGGNCAFIQAVSQINEGIELKGTVKLYTRQDAEHYNGYATVLNAVYAPLRQIIENSGGKPDAILEQFKEKEYKNKEIIVLKTATKGYDSLQDKVVDDMFASGIIDAVKVSRTVLENAVSCAAMFLTISATICENNEDEKITKNNPIEY